MAKCRPRMVLIAAILVLAGGVALGLRSTATSLRKVDRHALRVTFDDDFRHIVHEWDADDPRPEPERRQALFDFVYRGYDSSAWVPQSLFDGNRITQAVVGSNDAIVRDRIGLVLWEDNEVVTAFGMAPNPNPNQPPSWSANCLTCHMAEIDGIVYFGAGSKVLDEKALADTVKLVTGYSGRHVLARDGLEQRLASHAHDVMERHHHEQLDPLTRGRSTAFPASHVEMYMRLHDGAMPARGEVGRGDVKTPPLWHAAAKQPFGRWYCDGSFHAGLPLMASSMELELDQSFEKLVTTVLPTIKEDFRAVLGHLRPPKYPHAIDPALAEAGRALFDSEQIGCSRCHGTYDAERNVEWTGLHVDVGTDRSRIEVVSRGFIEAFDGSPLAAEGQLRASEGYAATPLTGVWANYPYLHNGSVPTLHHLLGPASERPRIFSVMAARKFDPRRVGQRLYPDETFERFTESELLNRFGEDRDWFNTNRPGNDNVGHDFWSRIKTDENRRALIEYLKTL